MTSTTPLRNGIVDLMDEWQRFFATAGVRMSVYNKRVAARQRAACL